MTPELFAELEILTGETRETLAAGFVVFLRTGTAMAALPGFGEYVVPMRIRLGVALSFAAIVTPLVGEQVSALAAAPGGLVRALGTEVIAGLLLGLSLRIVVHILQIAGTMAAQSTSLAQFFGGAGVDPQPALSQLLVMAGLALAMTAGLHLRIVEYFVLSYAFLPAGQFPAPWMLAEWGVGHVARAFALAFMLAAPFVVGALVYYVALGVINRAMPQLMVAFVGAPALTAGGLVMLMIVAPLAVSTWLNLLNGFLADPVGGLP